MLFLTECCWPYEAAEHDNYVAVAKKSVILKARVYQTLRTRVSFFVGGGGGVVTFIFDNVS